MSDNNTSESGSAAVAGVGAIAAVSNAIRTAKDAFTKHGGNEAIASVSGAIPQGTKDYFTQARSKFFNRDHIRSISVFFGVGEEKPFYLEKTPSLLISRVQHNVSFFYMNYSLLTAVMFCLTLIISPGAIIGIGLLGVAWLSIIRATASGSLQINASISISQRTACIAMGVVSTFVLIKVLAGVFWWTIGSAGVIVIAHALMRDASMHKDEEDRIEMTGDVKIGEGEDASFLNPQSNEVV